MGATHYWEITEKTASCSCMDTVGTGEGEKKELGVEKYWVLTQSQEKCLQGSPPLVPHKDPGKRGLWTKITWARPADMHISMASYGASTATPFRDCNSLFVQQIYCGKGSFPLWGLLGNAFIIACSWAWKKSHIEYLAWSWNPYWDPSIKQIKGSFDIDLNKVRK